MTAALVLIALVALAALGGIGYVIRCQTKTTKDLTETFSRTQAEIVRSHSDLVAQMVLGWKDSPPPSEPLSTMPNESVTLPEPGPIFDDMPDHIKMAYEREASEDAEWERMTSSTLS